MNELRDVFGSGWRSRGEKIDLEEQKTRSLPKR